MNGGAATHAPLLKRDYSRADGRHNVVTNVRAPYRNHKEGETMQANATRVHIELPGGTVTAEFHPDTGRLRILQDDMLRVELFPPHSWFTVASVAGNSRWGTRPREADLYLVLESFVMQRFGMSALNKDVPCAQWTPGPRGYDLRDDRRVR